MVMQSAFFKLANIIPIDDAVKYLKDAVVTSYGSKGEKVVNMNNGAIDHGIESLHRVNVPAEWKDAVDEEVPVNAKTPEFITKIQNVMNRQEGDKLKISELLSMEDGTFPVGGTAFEKRGTAISVPVWRPEKCIHCKQCAFACADNGRGACSSARGDAVREVSSGEGHEPHDCRLNARLPRLRQLCAGLPGQGPRYDPAR